MENKSYIISTIEGEINFLIIIEPENRKQVQQILDDLKQEYFYSVNYITELFSDYVSDYLKKLNIKFEMPDFEEA